MKNIPAAFCILLFGLLILQIIPLIEVKAATSPVYNLSVPQTTKLGEEVPISFTMSGVDSDGIYHVDFQVADPDNHLFNVSKTPKLDTNRLYSINITFPASFSDAIQALGTYNLK